MRQTRASDAPTMWGLKLDLSRYVSGRNDGKTIGTLCSTVSLRRRMKASARGNRGQATTPPPTLCTLKSTYTGQHCFLAVAFVLFLLSTRCMLHALIRVSVYKNSRVQYTYQNTHYYKYIFCILDHIPRQPRAKYSTFNRPCDGARYYDHVSHIFPGVSMFSP